MASLFALRQCAVSMTMQLMLKLHPITSWQVLIMSAHATCKSLCTRVGCWLTLEILCKRNAHALLLEYTKEIGNQAQPSNCLTHTRLVCCDVSTSKPQFRCLACRASAKFCAAYTYYTASLHLLTICEVSRHHAGRRSFLLGSAGIPKQNSETLRT